jgi:hypothetical protein
MQHDDDSFLGSFLTLSLTMMSAAAVRRTVLTIARSPRGSVGAVRNIQYSKQAVTPGITDEQRIDNILPVS